MSDEPLAGDESSDITGAVCARREWWQELAEASVARALEAAWRQRDGLFIGDRAELARMAVAELVRIGWRPQ